MKGVLNALMILSVFVVWAILPGLAIWAVAQSDWSWWVSSLVIGAGVLFSPVLPVGYMMLLGTALFWRSFSEGMKGVCSDSACGADR
jgi:hypothetical protein